MFKKTETKFLFPDELVRFRAGAAKRPVGEFLAVELMLDTMLRVSELVNADLCDVVGPDGAGRYTLHVVVKGGAHKGMPVSPEVFGALREYLARRGPLKPDAPLLANDLLLWAGTR